ncbi:hypothetical protein ACWIG4_13400 [Streptomyces sp. NPDC002248]
MADLRKLNDHEEPERDPKRGPTRVELLIAVLYTIAALAGCVEQLAR